MLSEFVDKLTGLATAALEPTEVPLHDPRSKVFVIGGESVKFDLDPAPRKLCCYDLDSLADLAGRETHGPHGPPAFWHWHAGNVGWIQLQFNDAHRLENATYLLKQSDRFTSLLQLTGKPLDQAKFIRALRISLADARNPDLDGLLAAVRSVKFRRQAETGAIVTHGRESLGRQVENELDGATEFPELVLLEFNIYADWNIAANIACAVEIDLEAQTFALTALPDQIDRAIASTHIKLAEQIRQAADEATGPGALPIYFGNPVSR